MSTPCLFKAMAPLARVPPTLLAHRLLTAGLPRRRGGPLCPAPPGRRHRDLPVETHSLRPEDKNQAPKHKRVSKNMRDFPLRNYSRYTHSDDLAAWAMEQDEDDDEDGVAGIDYLDKVLEGGEEEETEDGFTREATAPRLVPSPRSPVDLSMPTRYPSPPARESEAPAAKATPSSSGQGEEWPEPVLGLKDIPKGMRHMLVYKGMKQPIAIIIGKKGVDRGLLNCLRMHFRTHEVLKIRVSKMWKHCVSDMAEEVELKSGGVILERHGTRFILFRGYTHADIPRKTPPADTLQNSWWQS